MEEESIRALGTINLIEFNGQVKRHLIGISVKGSKRPKFYIRSVERIKSQGVEDRDNSHGLEEVAREEVPSRETTGEGQSQVLETRSHPLPPSTVGCVDGACNNTLPIVHVVADILGI